MVDGTSFPSGATAASMKFGVLCLSEVGFEGEEGVDDSRGRKRELQLRLRMRRIACALTWSRET